MRTPSRVSTGLADYLTAISYYSGSLLKAFSGKEKIAERQIIDEQNGLTGTRLDSSQKRVHSRHVGVKRKTDIILVNFCSLRVLYICCYRSRYNLTTTPRARGRNCVSTWWTNYVIMMKGIFNRS